MISLVGQKIRETFQHLIQVNSTGSFNYPAQLYTGIGESVESIYVNNISGSFYGDGTGLTGIIATNSSSFHTKIHVTSSTYTPTFTDQIIGLRYTQTGSVSINLPQLSSVPTSVEYIIKDEGGNAETNNITITPFVGDLIDGESSFIINKNYTSISIYHDSSNNWFVF